MHNFQVLSRYGNDRCARGKNFSCEVESPSSSSDQLDGGGAGVFVQVGTRCVVTDDLIVMALSNGTSFSLFSKLGVKDWSSIEERIFDVQPHEVL